MTDQSADANSHTVGRTRWISPHAATRPNSKLTKAETISQPPIINRLPIKFISNESDRFQIRYRIAVNQYSLNEHEYNYWRDLEKIEENTGNLYDAIPSAIEGNMFCADHPDELVLGYFSVSAKKSEFIYIDEYFKGQLWPYQDCLKDTLKRGEDTISFHPFLYDIFIQRGYWFVEDRWDDGGFVIATRDRGCVDCTSRGTKDKPDFWEDRKYIFK